MSGCSYVLLNILINAWRYLLMKKMLFILVSMLCLLLSAGCGSDKQAAQAPAADKVLRVATSPASPPFELYLKEQNKFTGFDIDLINDVAKKWAMTRLNL